MKSKRFFQIFLLLALLLSSFGNNQQVYASSRPGDQLEAVIHHRNLDAWDGTHFGYVSTNVHENWQVEFTEYHNFIVTVNPILGDFLPVLILLDSQGNELARAIGTLTSAQPAGDYSIQVQPQTGSGFYLLTLRNVIPSGPMTTTIVDPSSLNIGETALVTVNLNGVPTEGYTSAEFTCTYEQNALQIGDIAVTNLFGEDPALAINGPQNGRFIVAIAGSQGKEATSDGAAFTFNIKGLLPGQTTVDCAARVSKGDNLLTAIQSVPANLTISGSIPTPTSTPAMCDQAQLVADVTVPDGTVFNPGATFIKTWRLKNIGSCTWTTSYQIVFDSGEQMGATSSASFPRNVAPGQTVDISLNLTAPSVPGSYVSYWMFRNASGARFGIGSQANHPWWLQIRVAGATATPTFPPAPCDKAEFIGDVTAPAGTIMSPGQAFLKTWRLKNVGTCTWNLSYRIAFLSGEQMGAPSSVQLPVNVPPGVMVDISLNMIAPVTPGSYRGYWIFENETGGKFGIGLLGNQPWFADIIVSGATFTPSPTVTLTQTPTTYTPTPSITPGGSTATPIPNTVYDFAANMCNAMWFSGAGGLPCPGIDGNANGFVFRMTDPQLENGTIDTRPALLTSPQNVQNGYIQGFYPPFHVQNGDRFRSTIACAFGATNCYAAFRLDYQVGSDPIKTLWGPFLERYEGQYYTMDVSLSSLAGQDVKFILTILSAGSASGDRMLWVGPIIYRSNPGPTPIPSETVTPFESLTPTPLSGGTLNGQVVASKPVMIQVYDASHTLVQSGAVNADGTFALNVSSGTYSVLATAAGFLSAEGSVTITSGSPITLPIVTLIAGDIDNNEVIDPFDALTIGISYNAAIPTAADLNADGIINVLDLELLAKNYRKTGPIVWQ